MLLSLNSIKRRLFISPKLALIKWLSANLTEYHKGALCANFDPNAVLTSEGEVDNLTGDKNNVSVAAHSVIRGRIGTYGHGGSIKIGQWCYIGHRSEIRSMSSIEIGNRVLIAHDVNIADNTAHSLDAGQRHEHYKHILTKGHINSWESLPGVSSAPIVIEDDVWISFGVTILKGVRIGAGSVIAAGSIVTKDVPPGVLYRCEVHPIMRPLEETRSDQAGHLLPETARTGMQRNP